MVWLERTWRTDGDAAVLGAPRPGAKGNGRHRRVRASRHDSLHMEEQHGEAEQMEASAGSGVAGVVGGHDNGGGGRSAGRSSIRVRVCRGKSRGERGRGRAVGLISTRGKGGPSDVEGSTATAALAPCQYHCGDRDDGIFLENPLPLFFFSIFLLNFKTATLANLIEAYNIFKNSEIIQGGS